jgi:hypothetical protein
MGNLILFGEEWKRQVREARNFLEDTGLQYRFYDTTSNITNRVILFGLVEGYNTPILFDNGVRFDGITKIRQHFA